jgi:Zn-dependent metalloprotease
VDLRDLKPSGFLDGPFVSTKNTPNRIKRANRRFLFTRADRAFKEVMVYFHIDRVQRYIQELGFANALNHAISVHIDGQKDDNSHYSPTTKSLTFGTGGVDDAEDAEIILHEYGHALQDDQLPGFGASPEGGAMGEGFGDYLAASFFADVKPQVMRPTIGNWDAVAYSGAEPPCLRRLDSNKKYPKDLNGEVHDDGEIWSSCLWEIRSALGRRATDRLVLAHHFLLTQDATFEDGANALLTADTQLNKAQNQQTIRDVFVRRGILPNVRRKNRRSGQPFSQTSPRRPRQSARR